MFICVFRRPWISGWGGSQGWGRRSGPLSPGWPAPVQWGPTHPHDPCSDHLEARGQKVKSTFSHTAEVYYDLIQHCSTAYSRTHAHTHTHLLLPDAVHKWPSRRSHPMALWCLAHTGWWCTSGAPPRLTEAEQQQNMWIERQGGNNISNKKVWEYQLNKNLF